MYGDEYSETTEISDYVDDAEDYYSTTDMSDPSTSPSTVISNNDSFAMPVENTSYTLDKYFVTDKSYQHLLNTRRQHSRRSSSPTNYFVSTNKGDNGIEPPTHESCRKTTEEEAIKLEGDMELLIQHQSINTAPPFIVPENSTGSICKRNSTQSFKVHNPDLGFYIDGVFTNMDTDIALFLRDSP